MELICEDFYFYNNGVYKTISNFCPDGWFTDLKKVEPSIRIFGTRKQIDKALDTYIELTEMNLDECYDFKVEKKGSFFYDKEQNKIIKKKLTEYEKRYNKLSNNAALITTI
tara:strand:+ start:23 stop:355 length:333 start_codon:yes stop_codon:yes gene_type:complete